MIAGNKRRRHFIAGDEGSYRHASGQPFRQRHDVRLDSKLLIGEERPRTPHAALNFIQDQAGVVFVAELARLFQIAGRRNMDAALSLDRLQHNGAGFFTHFLFQRVAVAIIDVRKTTRQGAESFMIMRLPRGGQRRQRPPVKAVIGGDDLDFFRIFSPGVLSRQLDRALVRLGS